MKNLKTDTFASWLSYYLEYYGLTKAALADKANLQRSILSKIEQGRQIATPDTLTKIADALNLPQEYVYRQAGILRNPPSDTEYQELILYKINQLPELEQREIMELIDFKLSRQKQKQKEKQITKGE